MKVKAFSGSAYQVDADLNDWQMENPTRNVVSVAVTSAERGDGMAPDFLVVITYSG